ncbi:MAG TPA: hypothetical protein ENI15_11930 [Spirochaetes bacterium]|nr:hypothetical protein [Spirochaetota bacterium]
MLGKKEKVLENLESIKKFYLKLILVKHFQQDASNNARYENLHELTENERLIIEDINGTMKYIVPDLLILKNDLMVKEKVSEIDSLLMSVIQRSMGLRKTLEEKMNTTKKRLENLVMYNSSPRYSAPRIVNIRA